VSQLILRFWRDESGSSAVPYGLVVAAISAAIIVSIARIISLHGLGQGLK
jgi:Flp pilus assembly pilin Flp